MAPRMTRARDKCAASRYWLTSGRETKPLLTMYQPSIPCRAPTTKSPTSFNPSRRSTHPLSQNTAIGTKKAAPMRRPNRRWVYSNKKIDLNSPSVMPRLSFLYSGYSW